MVYGDIVLWLVFGPLVIAAVAFSIRAVLGLVGLRAEAEADYDYRHARNMVPGGASREHYVESYLRVNRPRGSLHTAAALWAVLGLTPVIAIVMEFLLELLWQATGQSRVFEPGYLVWAFFIFFGLLGAWAGIGYAVARRYHRHAPRRLEDEIRLRQLDG